MHRRIVTTATRIITTGRRIVTTGTRIVNKECPVTGDASGYFCLKVFDSDVCCY
jgi:hypothetical protein